MKVSKINTNLIYKHNNRFEGKHYLNNSSYLSLQLEKNEDRCCALASLANVFNPPVFKRQFCKNTNRSVQYFQSSDVPSAAEKSTTYIYRGQAETLNLLVKENDILVTGFGTIGNTRLVSKNQDGVCYANNVCRIRAIDHNGFLYAFISGKYGKAQLNTNASGSVVRYIEASGIKKTLVPSFPVTFQQEVDGLIQESARLREEAADALEKAKNAIITFCDNDFKDVACSQISNVNIASVIRSYKTRLDPPVFINKGVKWSKRLTNTSRLGDLNVRMWYPGIFKRAYVKGGLPYIKGSSVFDVNPFKTCAHLSKARTPQLDELWLKEGILLVSCAGACGLVKIITKEYEDKKAIGSPDIIRLVSNDLLCTTEYLYVYLQIPAVYDFMQSLKYGSVIERFDIGNLENVPIVLPTKEISQEVTQLVRKYMDCTYRAFNAEEKAIRMVEQEIEKWNRH